MGRIKKKKPNSLNNRCPQTVPAYVYNTNTEPYHHKHVGEKLKRVIK